MSDIVMPRLSDSMTEGTVVRWLKQPGEAVARGEPIVEIETDKATITYEADADGVLAEILVGEGETVPVGAQIARLQTAGEPAAGQPASGPTAPPGPTTGAAPSPVTQEQAPFAQPGAAPTVSAGGERGAPTGRVKASPIARRLARKLGVDLATVVGSGPGGRIVKEDVEAAASAAAAERSAPHAPTQAPVEPPPPEPWQPAGEPSLAPSEAPTGPPPLEVPPEPTPPEPTSPEPTPSEPFAQPYGAEVPRQPPAGAYGAPPSVLPGPSGPPPAEPPAAPSSGVPTAPQQPLPGPPPFIPGMTAGFPAVPPPGAQPFGPQTPGMQPPGMPPAGVQPPGAQPPTPQPAGAVTPASVGASTPAGAPGGFAGAPGTTPQAPVTGPTVTRGPATTIEPTGPQQTVARRMAESKATAPDFFVEVEVDMTNAVNYREQLKLAVQPTPSFNDMVVKACAQALRQFPRVNGAYKDGRFELYGDINIGVVVAAGELLAVPTVFNADQKGLAQIARESRELVNAVRTRTIQPAQLSGGTFSISNLGMYGVDRFSAILNPPQAAILAVGAIKRRPVIAEDGVSLAVRQMMSLTMSCDHRILYGAEAAEFLASVKAWLESPQSLQI